MAKVASVFAPSATQHDDQRLWRIDAIYLTDAPANERLIFGPRRSAGSATNACRLELWRELRRSAAWLAVVRSSDSALCRLA